MKAETDSSGCPSAGDDLPAPMMAGHERSDNMTKQEFTERTCDHLVAWFDDLYLMLREDRKDKKIEPSQKRQLIATAQSLLHDVLDNLEDEQKAL